MIDRKLQMAAAKREGMDVTDKELAEAIADIMKRNGVDDKQFEAALAKEGMTLEQYKSELREQMTLSRTFNKFVRSGLAVDEAEVARILRPQPQELCPARGDPGAPDLLPRCPRRRSSGQDRGGQGKGRGRAAAGKKGEDFIRLVKELSEGENAALGGDLGFMQRDQLISEIEEATRTLKPGEIAGPIPVGGGFHIIRLEEVRTPGQAVRKSEGRDHQDAVRAEDGNTYRTWLQTLRSEANIENGCNNC